MKDLVKTIVESIVDDVNEVVVNEIPGSSTSIVEVIVSKSDLGKVIGKQGKIAQSMRNIIYAASFKTKMRYSLDITAHGDK